MLFESGNVPTMYTITITDRSLYIYKNHNTIQYEIATSIEVRSEKSRDLHYQSPGYKHGSIAADIIVGHGCSHVTSRCSGVITKVASHGLFRRREINKVHGVARVQAACFGSRHREDNEVESVPSEVVKRWAVGVCLVWIMRVFW